MAVVWTVFLTVFLAELGDKTQLATLLFAAEGNTNRFAVFCAASAALVMSTLLAVLVGQQLAIYVPPRALKLVAGVGFVAMPTLAKRQDYRTSRKKVRDRMGR